MRCIVGLGNPGEKYKNNRHNVGQMFVDYLLDTLRVTTHENYKFTFDKHSQSEIIKLDKETLRVTRYALHDLILAKPQTFMNNSGLAVSVCVTSYKLQVTRDLIIVHDDLDIPLGKFKIQKGTGPLLHNGLESIENHLKTKDFLRIRIGIDNRSLSHLHNGRVKDVKRFWVSGETYVLEDFSKEEKDTVTQTVFPVIFTRISSLLRPL